MKETQRGVGVLVEEAGGAGRTTKLTDIIIKCSVNTKNGSGNTQSEHSRSRGRRTRSSGSYYDLAR